MNARLSWIPVVLLLFAGLFILFYPLPLPGNCLWGMRGFGAEIALRNCAWATVREASAMFLLPALVGIALIVAAVWSIALLRGVPARRATVVAGAVLASVGVFALIGYSASIDLNRVPTQTAVPVAVRPPTPTFLVRPGDALAAYFDQPPRYPGYPWTRNGVVVSGGELSTAAGPDHCGWESATFLTIGWPPGTVATSAAEARQYIRDPRGVVATPFRDRLQTQATMPADARPTGHRFGDLQIFVSPSDQDEFIYIQSGYGTERWPRSEPMTLCD